MFRYLLIFLILTVIGYAYDKYKQRISKQVNLEHNDIVRKYLLNENALNSSKPIVWVHLDYETNSRNWLDFGSRNSRMLNQPYKLITLQSIINHADDTFNVCLIDDDSFVKLMPTWSIDLNKLGNPIKTHMRSLALMKLLYTYGGFLVPSSYASLKPLEVLYNQGLQKNETFILETRNKNISSTYTDRFPNHRFMGCKKNSVAMKEMIEYIERLNSKDYTDEQLFLGEINKKCNELVTNNKAALIKGNLIGMFDEINKPVLIDDLLQSSYIHFSDALQGIMIPDDEILTRVKYQWFARMSPEQIYQSNLILSKYLLLTNK